MTPAVCERSFFVYDFTSRVRYSETDADAKLSLTGIMNYFQDCSTFHSEDSGVGVSYYEREKKAWLLSSWQIVIERRPVLGEPIRIATWPYEIKGIYGLRNFAMYDKDGNFLVKANSCWFLLDLQTGRPLRVTRADLLPYGGDEPRLEMDYAPRKIALPDGMREAGRFLVLRHQIDTNHHMNNAQYVEMARELIPEQLTVRKIRAEYRKAAVLGDVLYPRLGKEKDGIWVIALCKAEGEVCACVWLKTEPED